jgi:hypothetical protein
VGSSILHSSIMQAVFGMAVRISAGSGLGAMAVRVQVGLEVMKTLVMRSPRVSRVSENSMVAAGSSGVSEMSAVSVVSCSMVVAGASEGLEGIVLRSGDQLGRVLVCMYVHQRRFAVLRY